MSHYIELTDPTLMICKSAKPADMTKFGISGNEWHPEPNITYLSFQNKPRAEEALKALEKANVPGITVIPLFDRMPDEKAKAIVK
jgi:hypothetical protein